MDELVDGNQTAFICGRGMQDNLLLVQESAKRLHTRREASLLLKIDIAKAFDSVSWPFLLSVLLQCGFGPRWLRWITLFSCGRCIQGSLSMDPQAMPLHIGGASGWVTHSLLLIIAMDMLVAMFWDAEQASILSSLTTAGLKHQVSLTMWWSLRGQRQPILVLLVGSLSVLERRRGSRSNFPRARRHLSNARTR
jgi:hypothetical protein